MHARRTAASGKPAIAARDIGPDVLAFLTAQRLPATPSNYSLGYLVVSNPGGLAARAVDAITMVGDRLSQADSDRIVAVHGPKSDDQPGETEEQAKVRRHTLRLAELASDAVDATGEFGRALAAEQAFLAGGLAIAELVGTMIDRSRKTEEQLAHAAKQIDDLRHEVETAKGDAHHDALTGLQNRRGLLARLNSLSAIDRPVIGLCDIDRFKSVNDRYGHVVGDRVLKLVAQSLAESCQGHLVARWGGEEFVVLFAADTSLAQAHAVLDCAREELGHRNVRLRTTDEPLGRLSFSAGVAPFGGRSLDEAIAAADTLLYQAKANGRDQVLVGD